MKTFIQHLTIKIQKFDPSKVPGDAILLPAQLDAKLTKEGREFNDRCSGVLAEMIAATGWDPKKDKTLAMVLPKTNPSRVYAVCARGETKDDRPADHIEPWIQATKAALSKDTEVLSVLLDAGATIEDIHRCLEAVLLGAYRYEKPGKTSQDAKKKKLKSILFLASDSVIVTAQKALPKVLAIVNAVSLARDLVNQPANVVNPASMEKHAAAVAKAGGLKIKVLSEADLKKQGMNLILAVGMGSDVRPRLVHLEYQPKQKAKRTIALVGKGVTFDSGGLSLKPQNFMYGMKSVMAGSAAVLAVASALRDLALPVHVHVIFPLVENLVNGVSVKPGDVFVAANGKSVEIENTDAEGRLILADALVYAEGLGVDQIIDAATLTGAVVVALGDDISGMMGTDDKIMDLIQACGGEVAEKFWKLPLEKSYFKQLKSDVADFKNVGGGRSGGSIIGGLFLNEFVEKTPWVHLDIAGPAFSERDSALLPKGGTGFAVRTLLRYLEKLSQ